MNITDHEFCLKAVAYLKVAEASSLDSAMTLPFMDSPVVKDFGNGLLATYVVDPGDHLSYVQHRHLTKAGISPEQLHEIAVRNLAALTYRNLQVRTYGNIYAVLMGENFEASLIMVPEFWSDWYAEQVPNGAVAAFPARDILAFADSENVEGLNELRALCERGGNTVDHPLTKTLYRLIGTDWVPCS
jgi:hypothetical protein